MNNTLKILDAYAPLFYSDKTYFIISGGRGSGKSTQAAIYFLLKLFEDDYFRGVVSRYSAKSVKMSIYQDILDLAESMGVKSRLKISGDTIENIENGNKIITHSFKISDGAMQAKSKGLANVTHLIIDEATELPTELEYIKVIDSFRTKGVERKIFVLFNPDSKLHWLHKRFFIDGKPNPKWLLDHEFIHTTYLDNIENLDPTKVEEWERTKYTDPIYYSHHVLGEWREAYEGQIYSGWIFDYVNDSVIKEEVDVGYGLDFGFKSDPTACVKISKSKTSNKIWVKLLLYNQGLVNEEIYSSLVSHKLDTRSKIVCDSSEEKSIEELKRLGLRMASGAKKPPGSVINGIKNISGLEVHIDPEDLDLINEYHSYIWAVNQDIPKDKNNHAMDAIRYGLQCFEKPIGKYSFSNGLNSFHN